jgi:hypothetical protein
MGTLQGSGQISFWDMQAQLGGGDPIYFSEYYRGGGITPDIGANGNVPTSGTIYMSQMYNATTYVPPPTTAGITVNSVVQGSYVGASTYPAAYGSISPTTFTSTNGGKTIQGIMWINDNRFMFQLTGNLTGINNDQTFQNINVNGTVLYRGNASCAYDSMWNDTYWVWGSVGNIIGTGTKSVVVTWS